MKINLKRKLIKIFGDNLLFSFICGSRIQNKSLANSDIDIFCCVNFYNREQERKFRELYFSLHQKMKAKPDIYYPGELMKLKTLENRLRLAIHQEPTLRIKEKKLYDGLVWAGMLVDNKEIIFGQIPGKIISQASSCIKKWNKKLFDKETIHTKQLSEKIIYEDDIFIKTKMLLDKIRKNKKLISDILLTIESYETVEDELFRSMDCLKNIKIEKDFLNSSRVNYISAFFPVNLPLYSLIIFGFVPFLMAKRIFIRPPEAIAPVVRKLKHILLDNDDRLYISSNDRKDFIKDYARHSEVILFTGRYPNVKKIEKEFPNKLIIYNGVGINPIIVNQNADIDLASTKVLKMRTFNSGQDCAGPDAILVHSEVYDRFMNSLIEKLKKVKVGDYSKREVRIGKLLKPSNLDALENIFRTEPVVFGGKIDRENVIVYPTIITKPLNQHKNYIEFFAPIFWVSKFADETELKDYFKTKVYNDFAMYVSIFGDTPTFKIPKSIVLINQIVMDVERGNLEYGGYGDKANFISYKGVRKIGPILISREISQWKKEYS